MKQKKKLAHNPRKRVANILFAMTLGASIGIFLAIGWGENFRFHTEVLHRFAVFHRIPLPNGISRRDDVNVFEVELEGADDFARVYVNSYVPTTTERINDLVTWRNSEKVRSSNNSFLEQFAVERNHNQGRRGQTNLLRAGRNFVVYELENRGAYCTGSFGLFMNRQALQGAPAGVPVDGELLDLLGSKDLPIADALCSRRVIQIDVGTDADPVSRFRRLVGLE